MPSSSDRPWRERAGRQPDERNWPQTIIIWILIPAFVSYVIWDYFENYSRDRFSINERPSRPLNGSVVYENETIPWTPCGEVDGHLLECGSIEVPLDQFNSKFSEDKFGFDISVVRLRGRHAGHGRNLLIHPGNPGDSGMGFMYKHGGHLSTIIGEGHHIVSFDTRGLNSSWPQVKCFQGDKGRKKSLDLWYKYIKSKEDARVLWQKARRFVKACETNMGQHGKYTNSLQIAADMKAIRKGLGQDTLNFWGLSYGGVLGHTYSVLFPDRVGRVILDGSLQPKEWFGFSAFGELGYRVTKCFESFIHRCHSNRARCPFEPLPDDDKALRAEALSFVEKFKTLKTPTKVRLNSTHHGLIGRLDVWTKGIIPALGSPLKWHDLANRLASLMRGDPEEAFLAYGTYHEPPFNGPEMNDYYDLVVLNDAADGEWNSEEWNDDYRMSNIITSSFLDFHPTALIEFERFLQVTRWRNTLTNPVMWEDQPEEKPGNPILFISTGEPCVGGDPVFRRDGNEWLAIQDRAGHTSISMPSKCVALAIREFLDGRPPTSQGAFEWEGHVFPEWKSHVCRVDGPEFVHPDELEANAWEIVGDNEEDVRLYLAQVALARDTNWRIF